ncbi:hypothetical protein SAMN03080602_02278 [Arenibacter troitsensis]|uniref:Uncharacterized protein n=1 Tax=Arenibacter troitsensis TaxID=188872 RepID=A0A1X7JVF8_9FLAO|nr:hypothetical protein SAMN03080602_02278 [Arenibacter troitsensis]
MSNEKVIVIPLVSFYKSVLPHNFALQRNLITLNCTIFSGNCKKISTQKYVNFGKRI